MYLPNYLTKTEINQKTKYHQRKSSWCLHVMFRYSEKATKIWNNLPLCFEVSKQCQKKVEDCFKCCGLLRISELYQTSLIDLFFMKKMPKQLTRIRRLCSSAIRSPIWNLPFGTYLDTYKEKGATAQAAFNL